MKNYREDRFQSSPFQHGTDQQDRRTPGGGNAERISYEQLVERFKSYIAQQQEQNRVHGFDTSPEYIIRETLNEASRLAHTDSETRSKAYDFWRPLILAWDALAYDRYDPQSLHKTLAKDNLSTAYNVTRRYPGTNQQSS